MKILLGLAFISLASGAAAQKIGIGTNNPAKLLSLAGSLLIDQNNQNKATIDSAALKFGTITGVGIASNRNVLTPENLNGLDFYTNNFRRISITNGGMVGINDISPSYQLDVNGGFRVTGPIFGNDFLQVDGVLQVFNHAYLNQNLTVSDYVGIGTPASPSYKLNVGGNLLVETNIGINGNMRVDGTSNMDGKITNEGKGIVLSNTTTTLRTGFASRTFSMALLAGNFADVVFQIPTFSGNNSNVRVSVAQFQPGVSASNWSQVVMTPYGIDASDASEGNVSTVKVRLHNVGTTTASLGTNCVLYLLVVVTN